MATKPDANVAVVERLPFHILFTKVLTIWANWREWLVDWSACQNIRQIISLLHDGFTVSMEMSQYGEDSDGRYRSNLPVYDGIDRLILYFTVAEGWIDSNLLRKPGDSNGTYRLGYNKDGQRIEKNVIEARQMIAAKAFEMLCSNLFSTNTSLPESRWRDEDFHQVWYVVTNERLFPHVMSFFRVQEHYVSYPGEDFEMPNLRKSSRFGTISNNEKVATEFLLNLARFIWRWSPGETPYYYGEDKDERRQKWEASAKAERARLDHAKPWLIEVLNQLNRLNILREWLLDLDPTCLAKLKEIAFREYSQDRDGKRKVETLDEACNLDSKAAWLLKEYEIKKKESVRLSKIQKARRQKAQADRTIAELSRKK